MDAIVGRDSERATVARFVAAAGEGPASLAIEGPAGIGKTALWQHAVHVATSGGAMVLRAAPGEAEAGLTFSGLTDLLAPLPTAALDALPPPQRSALEAATLRAPAGDQPPDARAIGTGLTTLLAELCSEHPLVVAIDDVQWLDRPSADALQFATRRVDGALALLTSRRLPGDRRHDLGPVGTWSERIELSGLSIGATFLLIRDRLGVTLPRARLSRLWEAAQGNPLLALELARAVGAGDLHAGSLPVPDRLMQLLAARLTAAPADATAACVGLACAGRATIDLMRRAGLEHGAIAAEAVGLVSITPARVEFTHPLLASATLATATPADVRAMHRRLAGVNDDAEARARHLALSDPAPAADIADAVEAAAAVALSRGSLTAAIELGRLSIERTPAPLVDDEWRRRIALAANLFAAGESAEATEVLEARAARCPAGRLRADAELLMAEVNFQSTTAEQALACARLALEHADDPVRRARALLTLEVVHDDLRHRDYVIEALRCLESMEHPDPSTLAWARMAMLYQAHNDGEPVDVAAIDAAIEVERTGRVWRSTDNAAANRPVLLAWIDRPDAALPALDELEQRAEEEGNEGSIPYLLGHRASCLIAMARFAEAEATALRHLAHAEATAQVGQRAQAEYLLACVHAYTGDLEATRARALVELEATRANEDHWMSNRWSGLLGVIELARGDVTAARTHLEEWYGSGARNGEGGPAVKRYYVDYFDVVLACGERERAGAAVDWLFDAAVRSGRRAPLAAAHHGRALLAAADGDLREALAHLDETLAFDTVALNDLERGRALLLAGVVHRRLKQKAPARQALEAARRLFDEIGAQHFVARADAELARIGRRGTDRTALTDTERRIAELAAQGLTNREVAERAFVSSKTVEANLARAYRKLGIRSRAELGARMGGLASADAET